MKKIFLSFFVLVLAGAGCVPGTQRVEGNWFLSFDFPKDWVISQHYKVGDEPLNIEGVSREVSDVVIQSSPHHILLSGSAPEGEAAQEIGEIIENDYTYVRVLKLDTRRVIPSEAEDLGDGFYRLERCEEGGDCAQGTRTRYDYYFVSQNAKYQFMVWQESQNPSVAERVILSAQEVTIEE